jgi:hypothetical protein
LLNSSNFLAMATSPPIVVALAYRLYNNCEKTKQAEEARSYNGLVIAWPELERTGTDSGTGPAISRPFTGEGTGSSWLSGIAPTSAAAITPASRRE